MLLDLSRNPRQERRVIPFCNFLRCLWGSFLQFVFQIILYAAKLIRKITIVRHPK